MAVTKKCIRPRRPEIKCPNCRKTIFDGDVIKSRIVKLLATGAEAKCHCKSWVSLPIQYQHNPENN